MCDVKITAEVRGELAATFGVITFADLFHDSIADVDTTTTKFPKPCKDTDEALIETAKVYNDTCQIIIISDNPTIKEAVKNEQNIGVCTIKEFADAYK